LEERSASSLGSDEIVGEEGWGEVGELEGGVEGDEVGVLGVAGDEVGELDGVGTVGWGDDFTVEAGVPFEEVPSSSYLAFSSVFAISSVSDLVCLATSSAFFTLSSLAAALLSSALVFASCSASSFAFKISL